MKRQLTKRCVTCRKKFQQGKAESNYAFGRREHCSPRCEYKHRNKGMSRDETVAAAIYRRVMEGGRW